MDSDQGKLFVGGISWETTEEKLGDYFKTFGDVAETVIMKDRDTGRSRGFGFVVFVDPSVADRVLLEKHTIDGRTVEAKKAMPRDEQQNLSRSSSGGPGSANHTRTKKIFVGGLASTVTDQDFRKYFEQFGTITDVVVMYDHNTQRPRGFGFITFDSEDAVDAVLEKTFHELHDKMVEVKRAVPKELSAGTGRASGPGSFGRGSGPGSGYGGGYNVSPGGGGYGARPDNRYGTAVGGRGSYPYGASYGPGGYAGSGGFAPSMNGGYGSAGYGAEAAYGSGAGGAYGGGYGAAPSVGGYASAGGYGGNGSTGFDGTPVGGRNGWGGGGSSGYGSGTGSTGYGRNEASYGTAASWGGAPVAGQPTGSSSGYSTGGYGYAGNESGYGPSATSAYGSRVPSGYGEMYSSSGYADSTWRSADSYGAAGANSGAPGAGGYGISSGGSADTIANVTPGYGGSYGAAGRQAQRGSDGRF